ncbi:MAG: HlyD family secretion protein [Mojavia pulchra JT2-VF2]|jgi:HlyD family type I secretion membrane fusion protein|uniref:HlyD family secretion protein n=1 Tax=Mojavia pulchra JT2-VF2 TaxID=287848 RepID=A0A951UIS2_9NOST|nr:HlyD family secretion protein [Mojavia pulchra JT2-VF2]
MVSTPQQDFLPQLQDNDFLPPISRWTNLGGMFIVSSVGIAIILASVTKYNVTVKAVATVRPVGELRIVQAAAEGTIKSIKVKENQFVREGDEIAIIDNSQLQTQKSQLSGNIQQNQMQLVQITAQMNALYSQRNSEFRLSNRLVASAQADLIRNQRDYKERQITAQTQVQEAEASLELAKEEMKRYQQLANTGAIALLQIKEKEQALKAAQARLQRTKAALNPSNAPITMAQEQIAQERARGESTLATLDRQRNELIQRRVEIQNQLNRDRKGLLQIERDLKKSIVKAPATGIILKLNLRNNAQVLRSGETVAEIAPSSTPLVVKARVLAQDITKVQLCKEEKVSDCTQGKVQLRVSAYPYPDYGTLKAAVREISPDAITPQSNEVNTGVTTSYYEVTIQPEKAYLIKDNYQYPIQPGMEITADIISREETILTFILRKARLLTDL